MALNKCCLSYVLQAVCVIHIMLRANHRNVLLLVGDLTEENVDGDDKPLNSVALANFLSKAAKVTGQKLRMCS